MKTLLRLIVLWALPELSAIVNRVEPEYDPSELDRIRREGL
jgi:hypothetical protein